MLDRMKDLCTGAWVAMGWAGTALLVLGMVYVGLFVIVALLMLMQGALTW